MNGNFYDVVLLGTQLGPLLAGALVAKRGFRILVVGQDELPPTYEIAGRVLPRTPFTFLAAHSPIARRIFGELALHQLFRRRAVTLDPVLQVALTHHRVDLPIDDAELDREIEREFPEVRRPVEDFHRQALRTSAELDRLLERDLTWPPETFLERREFARASAALSFDRAVASDPFGEFPDGHPFRTLVEAPLRFADAMDGDEDSRTALRVHRLYAAWLRGSAVYEGGYPALQQMLFDKIRTHSGEIRPRERADAIRLRRGAATRIRLAGSGEEIGCSFVVAGGDLSSVLPLLPDRRPFEELFERIGEPQPRHYRYTLHLVVDAHAVPVGMGRDVFFVGDPKKPLHADNLLHVQNDALADPDERLLSIDALLPRRSVEEVAGYVEGTRERLIESVSRLVPFLFQHLRLIDSPHDGRPASDLKRGQEIAPSEPWTRGPSTMSAIYGYPVVSALGLAAMPTRTPIKRLLLCNSQVVPGLGMEGQFLAAWSTARLVTRADRKKEWMRKGLWTKVEM